MSLSFSPKLGTFSGASLLQHGKNPHSPSLSPAQKADAMYQVVKDTDKGGLKVQINGQTFSGKGAGITIINRLNKIVLENDKDDIGKYTLYLLASKNTAEIFKKAMDIHIQASYSRDLVCDCSLPDTIEFERNKNNIIVSASTIHSIQKRAPGKTTGFTILQEVAQLQSKLYIVLDTSGKIDHSKIITTLFTADRSSNREASLAPSSSSLSGSARPTHFLRVIIPTNKAVTLPELSATTPTEAEAPSTPTLRSPEASSDPVPKTPVAFRAPTPRPPVAPKASTPKTPEAPSATAPENQDPDEAELLELRKDDRADRVLRARGFCNYSDTIVNYQEAIAGSLLECSDRPY